MGRVNMAIARCFATVSRVEWKVRPRRRDQEKGSTLHARVCINVQLRAEPPPHVRQGKHMKQTPSPA
jgi:hypothetical protein